MFPEVFVDMGTSEAPDRPPSALTLYSDTNAAYAALSTEQRIAVLQQARMPSEEERERRRKDAEALEAKLRYIVEEVPDREYNRKGSMAGANSKTFDQYRSAKRREEVRVAAMEATARKESAQRRFEEEIGEKNAMEAKKTDKRRAKREKAKLRAKRKKTHGEGGEAPEAVDTAPVEQPDLD